MTSKIYFQVGAAITVGSLLTIFILIQQIEASEQREINKPRTDYERMLKFVEDQCQVEAGWTRIGPKQNKISKQGVGNGGGTALFQYCWGPNDSLWLYGSLVDCPQTAEDIAAMRVSVFGLNKDNEITQIATYEPVRFASNKTPISVTMMEFQIDASKWRMITPEQTKASGSSSRFTPSVWMFLESRDHNSK